MFKTLTSLALCLSLTLGAAAQQLEVNDAGGNLTRAGANPVPGTPFVVTTTGQIDFRVGGGANRGYILIFGFGILSNPSTNFGGLFDGQFLDLNQGSVMVMVDGFGGGLGLLPAGFGITNAVGLSNWSIPVNPSLDGVEADFQAIVADPTKTFGTNFTAASAYAITSDLIWSGDDITMTYTMPSGAYTAYGTTYTQISVCTNGFVHFGATTANSFTETNAFFIAGQPGGVGAAGPTAAIMYEDLNMIATSVPGGFTRIHEDIPTRTLTISWNNGSYFGAAPPGIFGTIVMTIQQGGGTPTFTYDYTGFTHATPPSEGIVGLSRGTAIPAASVNQGNLKTAGVINPYVSVMGPDTYFQNFDGTGTVPAQAFDLGGSIITIIEAGGSLILF